jgi:hypothetical protein
MSKPTLLANKIIKQMVEHLFSDGVPLTFEDYTAIRTVFRRLGGSWAAVDQGDFQQIEKLSRIVTAWGLMPEHRDQKEKVI